MTDGKIQKKETTKSYRVKVTFERAANAKKFHAARKTHPGSGLWTFGYDDYRSVEVELKAPSKKTAHEWVQELLWLTDEV